MNHNVYKPALTAAFIFAILGVIIGAMGAHALRPLLSPEKQITLETAVKYQFYHSFALAFAGLLHTVFPSAWIKRATQAFVTGIIMFSGSIYVLVYLNPKGESAVGIGKWGLITPIGGVLLIVGWVLLLLAIQQRKKQ
jgi:uncharacterized membrane protein YgdD (TMEM256/DUF423 family)